MSCRTTEFQQHGTGETFVLSQGFHRFACDKIPAILLSSKRFINHAEHFISIQTPAQQRIRSKRVPCTSMEILPDEHESTCDTMYPYRVAVKKELTVGIDKIDLVNRLDRKSLTPTVNLIRLEHSLDPVKRAYMAKMWILANPVKHESVDLGTLSNETISNICTACNDESVVGFLKKMKSEKEEELNNETSSRKSQLTNYSCDRCKKSYESICNTMHPYRVAVEKEPTVGTDVIDPVNRLDTNSITPTVNLIRLEHCLDPVIRMYLAKMQILANPVNHESVDLRTLSNETISNICTACNDESVFGFPKKMKSEKGEGLNDETSSRKSQLINYPCDRCQKSYKSTCNTMYPYRVAMEKEPTVGIDGIDPINRLDTNSITPTVNLVRLEYSLDPVVKAYLAEMWIMANSVNHESVDLGTLSNETISNICTACNDESVVGFLKKMKSDKGEELNDETSSRKSQLTNYSCDRCQKSYKSTCNTMYPYRVAVEKEPTVGIDGIDPVNRLDTNSITPTVNLVRLEYSLDPVVKAYLAKMLIMANPVNHESVDLGTLSNETKGNISPESNDGSVVGFPKRIRSERCKDMYGNTSSRKIQMTTNSSDRCQESFAGQDCDDVPFQSELCQERFSRKPNLNRRMETHHKDRPYQCIICSKKFYNKRSSKTHMFVHSGSKPCQCGICQKLFGNKGKLKFHVTTHTGAIRHQCRICQMSFTQKRCSNEHMVTHTRKKPLQCNTCQMTFRYKSSLITHMLTHSGEERYDCDVCQKSYTTKQALISHMVTHTGKKPYQCGICQKSFSRSGNLKQHMLAHTGEKSHQCDICQKSFKQSSNLKRHTWTHTRDKPYQCDICQKTFSQKDNLKRHIFTHTGEKPHQCDICQMTFVKKYYLNRHMCTHTEKKSHKCSFCRKSFKHSGHLKRHTLTHTDQKPYQCDICQKSFNQNAILKRHVLTHTGEKPHQCDICQISFNRNGTLKRHMLTHTGEKPYQCDNCQKTFVEKGVSKRHVLTHTGEKPHQCDICQKTFAHNNDLKRHMLTHTDEKPYQCDICQKSFIRSSQLKMHMSTHVGEKPHQCDVCPKSFNYETVLNRHLAHHTRKKRYYCYTCWKSFVKKSDLRRHVVTHTGGKK